MNPRVIHLGGGDLTGKRLLGTLLCVFILLLPVAGAQETIFGSGIVESIALDYLLDSPDTGMVVITYSFVNTEERQNHLEYSGSFFSRKPVQITRAYDIPLGEMRYLISQDQRTVDYDFSRVFLPSETYVVIVEVEISDVTDIIERGWQFRDVQTNSFEWPIKDYKVSVTLPKGRFTIFDLRKVEPGATISESGDRKTVTWERDELLPGEEFITVAEFVSEPNMAIISQIISIVLVLLLLGYILYTYGRGSFLFPMGFIKTVPKKEPTGESDVIAAVEKMFHEADHEVLITSPWIFYVDWFTSNVKQLTDHGINVRIVTHSPYERKKVGDKWKVSENKRQSFALARFLEMFPQGVVRLNENLHSKMIIVDGKKVLFSSANLTQSGLWENYEAGMWIENEHIAGKAVDYFEGLWRAADTRELLRDAING